MRPFMLALACSLALVGCDAPDWTPGPMLAIPAPAPQSAPPAPQSAPPALVPSCFDKGPGGRTWGHLCTDSKGPRSAELVCCEMRRGAAPAAPQSAPPAPAAPPQASEPPALTCPPGAEVRTMRCDGSGELKRPTCKPCKGRATKGGVSKRKRVSK